jgi:mRNA-degrading endonuclease toxin of MazEF toxin-antitoxin module
VVGARPLRRGQVWAYVAGSQQYRILILSGEDFNELAGAQPWAVTIRRTGAPLTDYLIALGPQDPLTGSLVEIPRVLRCDPSALREIVGYVSAQTMRLVEHAVRELLELP